MTNIILIIILLAYTLGLMALIVGACRRKENGTFGKHLFLLTTFIFWPIAIALMLLVEITEPARKDKSETE